MVMAVPLPIACTLTADELPARLEEIRAVSRAALRAKQRDDSRAVLRFDRQPGVRDRLAAIVAAEAKCCAFLKMTLDDVPEGIRLEIEAPADAEPVLEALLATFEVDSLRA